ncbi:MAG TPA: hypothetical protein VFW96_22930 [Thermomicrobiales bacterium]|nr:hypothetical protein [Thermomicrobiales bacterium]
MTRDWLLTMLVLSPPYLITAIGAIVILTLTRRRRTASEVAARPRRVHDGADRMAATIGIP